MRKNKLLSIGDVSKMSGATVKSLRYYDRIKLLEPAFVDPDTNYRYYKFDQLYFLEIIMLCVELDIPLKELTEYIDDKKTIDYSALLTYGKGIAQEKLKRIQRGLRFIDGMEQSIELAKSYHNGKQVYRREIEEKLFYVVPFEGATQWEVAKAFFDIEYDDDDYGEFAEYGILFEHSPAGIKRYAFMERLPDKAGDNCMVIPAGEYYCRQGDISQVEQAEQIFSEYLKGKKHFLAIDTEIFASKFVIDRPMHELRVITL